MLVREKLARRALKAGVSLPGNIADRLEAYFELLRRWNRKISLTALPVEDLGDEAIDRLLVEPLAAARFLPYLDATAIDIGSGGGSPAIPLKLALPKISMRMVESKTRKAAFLREVVRTLELDRTEVEAVRFEELLVRPALHDAADVLTMRAVKLEVKTLAGLQSFLKHDGMLLLFGSRSSMAARTTNSYFRFASTHQLLKQWGSQLEIFQKHST